MAPSAKAENRTQPFFNEQLTAQCLPGDPIAAFELLLMWTVNLWKSSSLLLFHATEPTIFGNVFDEDGLVPTTHVSEQIVYRSRCGSFQATSDS